MNKRRAIQRVMQKHRVHEPACTGPIAKITARGVRWRPVWIVDGFCVCCQCELHYEVDAR